MSIITTEHFRRPITVGRRYYDEEANNMLGFVVFLLSESMIFFSFLAGYFVYKVNTIHWLPPGVSELEVDFAAINTLVLVSSSAVIYTAQKCFERHNLFGFRLLLIATIAMGSYFLIAQALSWSHLEFGFRSGVFGGMFYLLTGFHGLHVFAGIVLQGIIYVRSFRLGDEETGYFGVNISALFWHFVAVIWIILFMILYLWQ